MALLRKTVRELVDSLDTPPDGEGQQEVHVNQPVRPQPSSVGALIAEAVRRSDIRTARGLLPALTDDDPMKSHWMRVLEKPRAVRVSLTSRDFSAEYRSLVDVKSRLHRTWAAIVGDRVVASAATLAELQAALRQRPPASARPLVHYFD